MLVELHNSVYKAKAITHLKKINWNTDSYKYGIQIYVVNDINNHTFQTQDERDKCYEHIKTMMSQAE